MAKLKAEDYGSFDPDELDVEWDDTDDYEPYDGELPKTGTLLSGYVKKMWWTFSSNDNAMIKVLWIADGNTGKTAEFNGLPVWDQIVFTPKAAFRYGPFLQVLGITLRDVFKKMDVADEDDNQGAPINKIAKLIPGEDAVCGVITKKEKYEGDWRVKVGKFVENPDVDDDDDEPEDDERPTRTRGRAAAKPAASSSRGAVKTPAGRRKAAEAEPKDVDDDAEADDDDTEDEAEAEEVKPVRSRGSRTTSTPAKAKPAAKRPARKAAEVDDDDEEPF